MGNSLVEIRGWEKAEAEIQKRLNARLQYATKEALEAFIPELEKYLREQLVEFYETHDDRKKDKNGNYYYDRTGEFPNSISVKLSHGGGYYGIKLYFDNNLIQVHPVPECGKFPAHANFDNIKIDAEELAEMQEVEYGVITFAQMKAKEYVEQHLSEYIKVSFKESTPIWQKDY